MHFSRPLFYTGIDTNTAFQILARVVSILVGHSLGGQLATTLTDHYFHYSFPLSKKIYLARVDGNNHKPRVKPLSKPHRPCPMAAILDFVVVAGNERVPSSPL